MENKQGYPHPQPGMAMPMPMPPTYDQSQYPPQPPHHQHHHHQHPEGGQGMYPPMPQPEQHHHIHYVPPQPAPIAQEPVRTVIVTSQVGPDPSMVCCPSCRQTVVSRMEYESSTRTHVAAGLLCLVGCWLCCCLPYCMDSCRNGNHYCPNCGSYLGTYRS